MDLKQVLSRLAKADFADAIGIALSSDAVAAAQLRKRFNTVAVGAFESRPLEGDAEQRWRTIADFVREFAGRYAPDGARVGVALDRRTTLFAHMQLPAAAADNLDKVVAYEADRLLPLPADSVYTVQHARPLGTTGDRLAVTIIAAPKDAVEAASRALSAVGLAPNAVSALPIALNDYYYYCRGDAAATAGIFNADGGREYLTLTSSGMLVSSLRFDAQAETRSERLERELEVALIDRKDEPPELIIDGERVEDGDLGLAAIAPPEFIPPGPRPTWLEAAAIGAALGQLNEARTRMNLLPAALARAEETVGLREFGLSAVVILLAVTLAASIAVKNLSIGSALAAEVERLLPKVSDVTKKEEENKALQARISTLEKPRTVSVLNYMRDMTARIPSGAYLTTFRYKGDRIEIDGIADNSAGLISSLEQSPHFKNVEFTAPTTKYLQDQERFSLKMELEQ